MNRGIQLKQLHARDLGHLGIPYHLLGNPPTAIDDATVVEVAANDRPLAIGADNELPDPLTITREVRRGLEQALTLLTQALPADCRPSPQHGD